MNIINHKVIEWARTKVGFSLSDAAEKLSLTNTKTKTAIQKLADYESGKETPSQSVLKKMEIVYKKPLITFYLKYIPEPTNAGEDFRTLPETVPIQENFLIETLVSDIVSRQSIIKSVLEDQDEIKKIDFIGSLDIDMSIKNAAKVIIKKLNIDINKFRAAKTKADAFNYFREILHQNDVFVLLKGNLNSFHTNISVENFRGFVLADDYVPFIVINNNDSKTAWTFTLLHEVVHLFIGKTGIIGPIDSTVKTEVFCNNVASEILLEEQAFENLLFSHDFEKLKNEIADYSKIYNISHSHLAYRLFKSGEIDLDTWSELSQFYKNQWFDFKKRERQKFANSDGGPNYYVLKKNNVGKALIQTTKRMLDTGALTPVKASQILGVRPLKIDKMFNSKQTEAA